MKILIAGAGEVGYHLIENLIKENLEIHVVDTDAEILDRLKSEFEVKTDHSNIVDSKYLSKTHLADTDLFIAITNSDETNMIACKTASEAGVGKTICRIRQIDLSSEKKHFSLKSLGIDWIINPVSLVADEMFQLVLTPNIVDKHQFSDGRISLTGYKIRSFSKMVNKTVGEISQELHQHLIRIGFLHRKDMNIIPAKDLTIKENDVVYFLFLAKDHALVRKFLGYKKVKSKSRRIFINGGGHIGLRLAQRLEQANQDVKVIEKNTSRGFHISERLQKALVLNFDGTDLKQLIAEGISDADYFISVTDDETINLTACLLAYEQGVERTICLVKQPELIPIIDQNTPISLGISPRKLTARYLVRFLQEKNIFSYFSPIGSQVEVLEIHLDDNTPCLKIPIKELKLPENVLIGMLKREDQFLLPKGDNKLLAGDTIVLVLHRLDRQQALCFFRPEPIINSAS